MSELDLCEIESTPQSPEEDAKGFIFQDRIFCQEVEGDQVVLNDMKEVLRVQDCQERCDSDLFRGE